MSNPRHHGAGTSGRAYARWTEACIRLIVEGLHKHQRYAEIALIIDRHPEGRRDVDGLDLGSYIQSWGGIRAFLVQKGGVDAQEADAITKWYVDNRQTFRQKTSSTGVSQQSFTPVARTVPEPASGEDALTRRLREDALIAEGISSNDSPATIARILVRELSIDANERYVLEKFRRYGGVAGFLAHAGYALGRARELAEKYERAQRRYAARMS